MKKKEHEKSTQKEIENRMCGRKLHRRREKTRIRACAQGAGWTGGNRDCLPQTLACASC